MYIIYIYIYDYIYVCVCVCGAMRVVHETRRTVRCSCGPQHNAVKGGLTVYIYIHTYIYIYIYIYTNSVCSG